MKLKCEDHDKISILTIGGEFTIDHIDNFRRSVNERVAKGIRDFVLQVEDLGFIDSAGLETLVWLQDEAATHLGQVRLVSPSDNIRKILEITRLEHQIDTHDQVTEAIRSLR